MRKVEFTLNIPKETTFVNMCTGLVHHASEFTSNITIQVDNGAKVDLKSILGVMSLVYANNKNVYIEINGDDENEAFECITRYSERLKA